MKIFNSTLSFLVFSIALFGITTNSAHPAEEPNVISFCADFELFPDNHKLPANFKLSSFVFQELNNPNSWFVNLTDGRRGLQFSPKGVEITLPLPVSVVEFEIGLFNRDAEVSVINIDNKEIQRQTLTAGTYRTVSLEGSKIAKLILSKGGHEAILPNVCVSLTAS